MKYKVIILLLLFFGSFLHGVQPAVAVDDHTHWKKNCTVDPQAANNTFVQNSETYYFNVEQKVLWEIANDFCVSLDLLVAYNFVLLPSLQLTESVIKIPPSAEDLAWLPGQSLEKNTTAPAHLLNAFYFDETPPDQFAWPISEEQKLVSQLYHSSHHGLDMALKPGTQVKAIANGRVVKIERDHKIYGVTLVIDHGNDLFGMYAHLLDVTVELDQFVTQGETVALSGNSGRSSAPHLHVEIREEFRFADPCNYLAGCPVAAFHGPRYQDITLDPAERAAEESGSNQSNNTYLPSSSVGGDADIEQEEYARSDE
ncbi:MAG: M23 family metallopeptidase [Chloroflexota bacterium]